MPAALQVNRSDVVRMAILSILYLRCFHTPVLLGADTLRITFNSLFEMRDSVAGLPPRPRPLSILYLRCFISLSCLHARVVQPFNSLFEMQRTRGRRPQGG